MPVDQPGTLARLCREPLLHFIVIGAFLAGAVQLLQRPAKSDQQILVTPALVERLANLYRLQTGSQPDSRRREWLVQNYIREEMFFREAKSLRLDEGDELVRRRLVQKLEFLQADAAVPAEPDEATLRAYHTAHPELFLTPAKVSFSHVFFSPDKRTAEGARKAAAQELASLTETSDLASIGDRFSLKSAYEAMTPAALVQVFGPKSIAEAPFNAEMSRWTGPVESGFGWHLIRVTARAPPRLLPFEDALDMVRKAWTSNQLELVVQKRLEELSRRYTIVRNDISEEKAKP